MTRYKIWEIEELSIFCQVGRFFFWKLNITKLSSSNALPLNLAKLHSREHCREDPLWSDGSGHDSIIGLCHETTIKLTFAWYCRNTRKPPKSSTKYYENGRHKTCCTEYWFNQKMCLQKLWIAIEMATL